MSFMHAVPINSLIIVALLLQLAVLTLAVQTDPYIRKDNKKTMMFIVVLLFTLIMQNYIGYRMDVIGTMPYWRTIVGIYGYMVRPTILLLFLYIVSPDEKHLVAWILIIINALVHLTALFSGICFYIDAANEFHRGPLGFTCHAISLVLMLWLLVLTMREFNRVKKLETWIPVINLAIITVAVIVDTFMDYRNYPASFLTISAVSCSLSYDIWLHFQFARRHEQTMIADQRIRIMISQIQPHFLYNTLSTIQALCRIDPEKAFETTEKFGMYLRNNLESLNQSTLIPFEEELEHTKIYADIEMIRFPKIDVTYDIEDVDFEVPALSLQPIVENAIRHGVRVREHGVVAVSAKRIRDLHVIKIKDNGKGFDIAQLEKADSSHIGIRNVKERVETLCGGQMTIRSNPGKGTTVWIRIPVDNNPEDKANDLHFDEEMLDNE